MEFHVSHDPALSEKLAPISSIINGFGDARTELDQFVGELLERLDNEYDRHTQEQSQSADERKALERQIEDLQTVLDEQQSVLVESEREEIHQLQSQLSVLEQESAGRVELLREVEAERDILLEQIACPSDSNANKNTEQIESLDQQNQELQTELDIVRGRAVDLNARLRESERLAAQERASWSGELGQMRRMLEQQMAIQAAAPATMSTTEPATTPMVAMPSAPATVSPVTVADAVLTNVMAQFELVQQDAQRHRTAG
jgi:chromosome segregation ATPase